MRGSWLAGFSFMVVMVAGCNGELALPKGDQFSDLQRFVGRGPNDLVVDPEVGPAISQIVSPTLSTCMDDVFNYASDIELLQDGSIRSSALGSRADSDRAGYVSVHPSGRIDVILWCDHNRNYYFWYSSAPLAENASLDLITWARVMMGRGPTLRRFGETHIKNFGTNDIQKGELFYVLTDEDRRQVANKSADKSSRNSGDFIRAGAVVCVDLKSFYKVNAIEISGNQYVPLPGDCENVGVDIPVNILRRFSDPVVGNVALVGNAGGSILVRMKDLN